MKSLILTLFAVVISLGITAQQSSQKSILSGKVIYQETQKIDIQLEGDASAFADMIPKEQSTSRSLLFNEKTSLYQNSKFAKEDQGYTSIEETEGVMVQVQVLEEDNKTFTDFNSKTSIEQREFMSRTFLIEKPLTKINWKVTGKQKEILGYACTKAVTLGSDKEDIVAWFAPQIPVPAGPDTLNSLPGLILELNIDNGDKTIVATSVEEMAIDENLLKKPNKGKKVTAQKFNKIVEEKMKEMGAESGEGVHTIVEIQTR